MTEKTTTTTRNRPREVTLQFRDSGSWNIYYWSRISEWIHYSKGLLFVDFGKHFIPLYKSQKIYCFVASFKNCKRVFCLGSTNLGPDV